jgi:hypothetical protein
MAHLIRDSDGQGCSGCRVQAIDPVTNKVVESFDPVDLKTLLGKCLLVGTITAGTYSDRDYWITSPVTEIVSETTEEIKFKTKNSTYTLKK